MKFFIFALAFILSGFHGFAQTPITKFQQFNGQYDYLAIGNTLNVVENENSTNCTILTSSSANLNLAANQNIIAAYLYWAGSGPGDFNVSLNNQNLNADRTFNYNINNLDFFAAFKDVTTQVQSTGTGTYTLSNLDLTNFINNGHCNIGMNFGGWSIIIVYEDLSLPLNQVDVFDGFVTLAATGTPLSIQLNNLNVIDNQGAKIGFLTWEGDSALAVNETLKLNGNTLSNSLNPSNNAFNGTNSFTGATNLYNMDLDVYDVQNYINIGDTMASIELNSSADIVFVSNIVTVFNSTLPDPTPSFLDVTAVCNTKSIDLSYRIANTNGTDVLPANTSVKFFANNTFLKEEFTPSPIAVGAFQDFTTQLNIPNSIPQDFNLKIEVNLDANKQVIIPELNKNDNTAEQPTSLIDLVIAQPPQDLKVCQEQSTTPKAIFDFSNNLVLVKGNQTQVEVSFFTDLIQAQNNQNPITDITAFENTTNPQEIFIRLTNLQDPDCFLITSFTIQVYTLPQWNQPDDIIVCNNTTQEEIGIVDLTVLESEILSNPSAYTFLYFTNLDEAESNTNPIHNPEFFENNQNPMLIYIRIQHPDFEDCYVILDTMLIIKPIAIENSAPIKRCDLGYNQNIFDLYDLALNLDLKANEDIVDFYTSFSSAQAQENPIKNPYAYQNTQNPQEIYLRTTFDDPNQCHKIYSLVIGTKHCPPWIPEGFSPNDDGINDVFRIKGLYTVFERFELKIFSRYGNLVYQGNNQTPNWDGTSNVGLNNVGKQLPTGTYFYVLNLNDPDFKPIKGWVYLNR